MSNTVFVSRKRASEISGIPIKNIYKAVRDGRIRKSGISCLILLSDVLKLNTGEVADVNETNEVK